MIKRSTLARMVRDIGFSCTRCGVCCKGTDNLVMVSPQEVCRLAEETGLESGDIATPYPEFVETRGGGSITFEWAVRKHGEACRFYSGGLCTAYTARPWICRTFPFMLDNEHLIVSHCPGIGGKISRKEAWDLAGLLLERRRAELTEEERVRQVLSVCRIPPGCQVLVDGTGLKVL